jgi:uncharacterized membrane protein YdbT with pleckstrin-like domain
MNRMNDKNKREIRPIIIRKSIAMFVIRVILLELVFEVMYLTWRGLIHFLPFSVETVITLNSISLIFFLILVTVIQNTVLIYIALIWSNDYYEFRANDIAHFKGVLTKSKQSYQYQDIQSISIQQSILGRLFNYGNITLLIPTIGHDVHFNEVTDPKSFVELLKSIKPDVQGPRYILNR